MPGPEPRRERDLAGVFRDGPPSAMLAEAGVVLERRLEAALLAAARQAVGSPNPIFDSHVFHALLRMHASDAWYPEIERAIARSTSYRSWLWLGEADETVDARAALENEVLGHTLRHVLHEAIERGRERGIVGPSDFLRAVSKLGLEHPAPKPNFLRPHTADLLCELLDGERHLDVTDAPVTTAALRHFGRSRDVDDLGLLLTVERGRLVIRPSSPLAADPADAPGLASADRCLILPDVQRLLGVFTTAEIAELEELLNAPSAAEDDFQRFFEAHPHFLQRGDYTEVKPHVILARDAGPLIPDFVLLDRAAQRAAILELKLPTRIVRRQTNRDRFAAAVMEARTQLLRYRDWFEDAARRQELSSVLGMEVFRPRLAVLIGRSADFHGDVDRQRLAADVPDLDVITYDDVVAHAKRRLVALDAL